MPAGGLFYFHIYLNDKELSCDKVYDKISSKRRDEITLAIREHIGKHVPKITFTQIEFNGYGCLVDFAADKHNTVEEFSLPDLSFALGKQSFRIEFDDFYPTNGGSRSKTRRVKRNKRRLTRRK